MVYGSEGQVQRRSSIDGSHLVVAVVSVVLTILAALASIASWKGSIDANVTTMQKQLDRMDDKLDRLIEARKVLAHE